MAIPTYVLKIGKAIPKNKENMQEMIKNDFLFRQYVRILELIPFLYLFSS